MRLHQFKVAPQVPDHSLLYFALDVEQALAWVRRPGPKFWIVAKRPRLKARQAQFSKRLEVVSN